MYRYKTRGTCSSQIDIDVQNGIIQSVQFMNGCNGNLKALSKLVEGMPAQEAIGKLRGIECGMKGTSCADQLARALMEIEGRAAAQ
ncbi:TIGR03905 family TSCPD domain-containing protein [Eubacteriales bacterium OttesenSCG-928-N13]|nr:TIGR03905 family TSCPD domain-containing protein [Eubacteriales bacterium OttesenSCG-928-N13]